jgi:mono/diheme cytochrome c family protein/cytochrome c553
MSERSVFRGAAVLALLLFFFPARTQATIITGPALAAQPEIPQGELLLGELNCAACHKTDEASVQRLNSRTPPILGSDGMRITPQYLRRFLSAPHQYKPGTLMPDLLHDLPEAEKSDTVEALVHFLISTQGDVPAPAITAEEFHIKQGRTLFHSVGCVACHTPEDPPSALPGTTPEGSPKTIDPSLNDTTSIPLGDLARKTTVSELTRFLLEPAKIRPSGRMPSLALSPSEAVSIATYLLRAQVRGLNDPAERVEGLRYQYYEQSVQSTEDLEKLTPAATGTVAKFSTSNRKRENTFAFRFTGSIHIPKDGRYVFYSASDDGSRLYIDDKLVVDNDREHAPEEKRGSIELKAGDHAIMAGYFQGGGGHEFRISWSGPGIRKEEIPPMVLSHLGQPMRPLDSEEFTVNREKADKGRQLFASLGCAACHKLGNEALAYAGAKPFPQLTASETGCLSAKPKQRIPKFDLSDSQRAALRDILTHKDSLHAALSPREQIVMTMGRLNCYACHSRDGKGGPTDARLAYYRVIGEVDMGDEGRIPPHLTGIGAKLRPDWIHEVLVSKGFVRPYMATRMPQFKEDNIAGLPGLFQKADQLANAMATPETSQRDAKYGRRLVSVGGLSCISCHTFAGHKSLGIPAIDMTTMTQRLNYDWFHRYLIDPPSLRPGTRMPTFWPNGVAVNKDILNGDTKQQIRSIWAYLAGGRNADLPSGLIQGRKEIVAETEPVIYRNFIQGAGTRAIGVGYPEKVNLAFDANNLCVPLIWQGAFIDDARHSSGRGEGFEPPLGNNVYQLPEGSPFAVLSSTEAPWPSETGKAAGYQMHGYRFDQKRRPAFLYEYKGLQVEDKFDPVVGELDSSFRRTINIVGQHPPDNFYFRAAIGNKIERKDESTFVVDNKLNLKFSGLAGANPVMRQSAGRTELLIPIRFKKDRAQIVEDIVW